MNKARRVPDYIGHILQAMRNRLTHGYDTVDLNVVWKTVQRDLPVLRGQIEAVRS